MNSVKEHISDTDQIQYWSTFFYNKKDYLKESLQIISNQTLSELLEEKKLESYSLKESIRSFIVDKHSSCQLPTNFKSNYPYFNKFTERFLKFAYSKLQSIMKKRLNNHIDSESMELYLLEYLDDYVHRIVQKSLVLELNLARETNVLEGTTSEERFTYFQQDMLGDSEYVLSFLNKYPQIYEYIVKRIDYVLYYVDEILAAVEKDWEELCATFEGINDGKVIRRIILSAGDSHNKGRTVCVLVFNDNSRILYKPRSLKIDVKFKELLEFINKKNKELPDLRVPNVIDKGIYGWTEFIVYEDCKEEEEIKRFYTRLGMQLALLYVFNATDFHYENIIAQNEYPILIDLESLFHQDVSEKEYEESAFGKAEKILDESVMASGMLPNFIYQRNGKHAGIDLSGFNGRGNQEVPIQASKLTGVGTDSMHYEKSKVYLEEGLNLPRLNNELIDIYAYLNNIIAGFKHIYRFIETNKEIFKKFTMTCKDIEVRVILRPTFKYGEHLRSILHPGLLASSVDTNIFLHRLYLLNYTNKKLQLITKKEIEDLLCLDIPIFKTKIGSKHIQCSDGEEIKNYFSKTALENVIKKIEKLNSRDLEEQIQVINMSMLASNASEYAEVRNIDVNLEGKKIEDYDYIKIASEIGDYLIDTAIKSDHSDDVSWISTVLEGNNEVSWMIAPVGLDFYNGNSGIALYLAYLYKFTGNKIYKDFTYRAIKPVIEKFELYKENPNWSLGVYSGVGGGILSVFLISRLFNDEHLFESVKKTIKHYVEMSKHDRIFDIIGGSSGALNMLMHMYQETHDEEFLKSALVCSNHLYNNTVLLEEDQLGWISVQNDGPMTGYSHGNAGILSALSRVNKVVSDERFRDVIKKGLAFERSYYDEKSRNWKTPGKENAVIAWCHGAPGILLSRLKLKENGYIDEMIDTEIEIALDTTLREGFGNNRSYCHGDYGQLEILMYANEILQSEELAEKINLIQQQLITILKEEEWKYGVSRGTDAKGLLVGLSGIGMGLLKQLNRNSTPNIITF
ncbi:type 2 lanthipeptide synthetase LanM family protein [Ureibacillus aquaedulcis]|uniref:Type 2 lanthipeptide synthetase LanM family protein n=1 Tax=Ureibacillus aquaedulcis TaxID=3058421 RepID=A0ABT8GVT4_9BACL|nr:type 2 lanthipeptide synthetase LanM family protein [Ureibacillus sp. BA0131]MDN4495530.1 type 2 lanthipeptide synthetase LanM family protein [Ureibacillus sp. BA0131]